MSFDASMRGGRTLTGGRSYEHVQRTIKWAVVRTADGTQIRGRIHIPPGTRTLDFLNRDSERFIAVTEARVTSHGQTEQSNFVAVNKAQITSMTELPEPA